MYLSRDINEFQSIRKSIVRYIFNGYFPNFIRCSKASVHRVGIEITTKNVISQSARNKRTSQIANMFLGEQLTCVNTIDKIIIRVRLKLCIQKNNIQTRKLYRESEDKSIIINRPWSLYSEHVNISERDFENAESMLQLY